MIVSVAVRGSGRRSRSLGFRYRVL